MLKLKNVEIYRINVPFQKIELRAKGFVCPLAPPPAAPSCPLNKVLRYDRDHEEQRGGGRQPSPPGPDPDSDPQDDPESRAASFRQLYDLFLALALAFSVLEMLIFRLGRRRLGTGLSAGDNGRGRAGSRGLMFSNGLESLLDEEDLRQTGWEGWSAESVQQVSANFSLWYKSIGIVSAIEVLAAWLPLQQGTLRNLTNAPDWFRSGIM